MLAHTFDGEGTALIESRHLVDAWFEIIVCDD
jgi:hypothetical protein